MLHYMKKLVQTKSSQTLIVDQNSTNGQVKMFGCFLLYQTLFFFQKLVRLKLEKEIQFL